MTANEKKANAKYYPRVVTHNLLGMGVGERKIPFSAQFLLPLCSRGFNKVCLTGGDDDDDANPLFVVNSFQPEQGEIMGDRHSCWRVTRFHNWFTSFQKVTIGFKYSGIHYMFSCPLHLIFAP